MSCRKTQFFKANGCFDGFITHSNEVRVSGKSAIYYIINSSSSMSDVFLMDNVGDFLQKRMNDNDP